MGVEEGERVPGGDGGAQQPRGDESLSLPLADNTDDAQALQVLVQLIL